MHHGGSVTVTVSPNQIIIIIIKMVELEKKMSEYGHLCVFGKFLGMKYVNRFQNG